MKEMHGTEDKETKDVKEFEVAQVVGAAGIIPQLPLTIVNRRSTPAKQAGLSACSVLRKKNGL
jgi:hypothetical protein